MDNKYSIHLAPIQGVTDAVFRTLFSKYFGGVDAFYTPFIRIEHGDFRSRDMRDLAASSDVVPQVLPGSADELRRMVDEVAGRGFRRVDINLGCPFPPIAAHGRGCVLLTMPDKVADILSVVPQYADVDFSVKMRLGFADATQWQGVIDVINATPLTHVAVHARYGKQQYKGECDMEAFAQLAQRSSNHVIYNGDILTAADAEGIVSRFPNLKGVMIGRGLLANPALARQLRGEDIDLAQAFRQFHAELLDVQSQRLCGDAQIVAKMKGYWEYMLPNIDRKARKHIHKATTLGKFVAASAEAIADIERMLTAKPEEE